MIRHIFLNKANTIIKDSEANVGLNPILELNYGRAITRFIIQFDTEKIEHLLLKKEIKMDDKLRFFVHLTNCASINGINSGDFLTYGGSNGIKERASSFDIIAFKVPQEFDEGIGFNYKQDIWNDGEKAFSFNGSNWFQSYNGYEWPSSGIYSYEKLEQDYLKYMEEGYSVDCCVIGRQHFDFGDEDLNIDVSDYVFSILNGSEKNYGIGFAFSPKTEKTKTEIQQYVGFFGRTTNTFYNPYLELKYNIRIKDDRGDFYCGKENNLLFTINSKVGPINLDDIPSCSIEGENINVEQLTTGVYMAKVTKALEPNQIYEDLWDNILIEGEKLEPTSFEFHTKPSNEYYMVNGSFDYNHLIPSVYGIYYDEKVRQGDIRTVCVDFRVRYETNKKEIIDDAFYRLYIKDGDREIDVLEYQPIDKYFTKNSFTIYTEDLIPQTYYIDIKIKRGGNEEYFKNVLSFKVVNNITKLSV